MGGRDRYIIRNWCLLAYLKNQDHSSVRNPATENKVVIEEGAWYPLLASVCTQEWSPTHKCVHTQCTHKIRRRVTKEDTQCQVNFWSLCAHRGISRYTRHVWTHTHSHKEPIAFKSKYWPYVVASQLLERLRQDHQNFKARAGEMAQCLQAQAALNHSENFLISSTHLMAYNYLSLQFQRIKYSFLTSWRTDIHVTKRPLYQNWKFLN